MGNSQTTSDPDDNLEAFERAICRNMSEYQLSLYDGQHSEITEEVYISLNREIFAVTGDEEFIEKHRMWLGKNTDEVPKEDVQVYREKFKFVGKLIDTRVFTAEELVEYDGLHGKGIYLAAKGLVFDVSSGEDFYGPDRGYHIFAGRNAQRALALVSLKMEEVENTDISDLDETSINTLNDWIKKYHSKYVHVGYLNDEPMKVSEEREGDNSPDLPNDERQDIINKQKNDDSNDACKEKNKAKYSEKILDTKNAEV